jgi:hypothetical protein
MRDTGQSRYQSRDLAEQRADPGSDRGAGEESCRDRDRTEGSFVAGMGRGDFWGKVSVHDRVFFWGNLFIKTEKEKGSEIVIRDRADRVLGRYPTRHMRKTGRGPCVRYAKGLEARRDLSEKNNKSSSYILPA